jgi:high-affinity iron transporter
VWADAVPNLLIGLREGLEGGLVVSILLAALKRTRPEGAKAGSAPVWLGVLAAVLLAISFGAVLTFSRSALSNTAQEAFGGTLSLIAVCLVTAMVFWMRRTARGLSRELSAKVGDAIRIGAGALALTAFLAVGREGLETALFLWTTVQAAGESTIPLIGAAAGIGIAALLCWLLYRSAIRINLGVFFSRTAVLLVIIAAGVLAYGLGELQDAGILPGRTWLAFDLTETISPDAWWVTLVRGVTNLTPSMTWLQVTAYVVFVTVVLIAFFRKPTVAREETPAVARSTPQRIARLPKRWAVAAAVVVPLAGAGVFAMVAPSAGADAQQVTITASACAPDVGSLTAGAHEFTVANKSGRSGEIYLIRQSDGGVIGEVEGIGPGTRRTMPVNLAAGEYAWRCVMSGAPEQRSAAVVATGAGGVAPPAVVPISEYDLEAPLKQYQDYVAPQLSTLATQAETLRVTLSRGDLDGAKAAWLQAQLTWERVGAAYGSFGDLAEAIGRSPNGLPDGTMDKDFTGLRRIEYGLFHGQSAADLVPVSDRLAGDIVTLREKLPTITADPGDLPLRAHEILEDSLRDKLSGASDQGANTGYQETLANIEGTRVVLDELTPLLAPRRPDLVPTAKRQLDTLEQVLKATTSGPATAPLAQRQRVNAATGQVLETLAVIPDLLEIRQG